MVFQRVLLRSKVASKKMNNRNFIFMIQDFVRRYHVILLLAVLFILFFYLAWISESTYGGADNISHYRISRYAFKYPHLFLDLWGKPVFNFLTAPFAQLGLFGIKLFNIFAALGCSYFCFLICREFNLKYPFLVIFFICFAPMYFILALSGLTETLFSFILVLSIFLFIKQRYIFSALLFSFLPFSRQEGIFILPLVAFALLLRKKYYLIPFLAVGGLVLTLIGYFTNGDILWLIHKSPYKNSAADIYGHGEFFHYIKRAVEIIGVPLTILFLLGLVSFVYSACRNKRTESPYLLEKWILLFGSLFIFLFVHSLVWWKGWSGSAGLTRVMACIVPLGSIFCLYGFNFIVSFISRFRIVVIALILILIMIVIKIPFSRNKFPMRYIQEEKTIKDATDWLMTTSYGKERMIYYFDPYVCYFLEIDPYDPNCASDGVRGPMTVDNDISRGSILIWDLHFGPNEGRMPLESLLSNPDFQLLKSFDPPVPFKVWTGDEYKVYVFLRK